MTYVAARTTTKGKATSSDQSVTRMSHDGAGGAATAALPTVAAEPELATATIRPTSALTRPSYPGNLHPRRVVCQPVGRGGGGYGCGCATPTAAVHAGRGHGRVAGLGAHVLRRPVRGVLHAE